MEGFVAIFSLATVAWLFAQKPATQYRITHSYLLGGDGSWDYVVPDPPITVCSSRARIA